MNMNAGHGAGCLRAWWLVLAALIMLQLAGCAAFAPPRPFTTEAEAISARGEPTRRWDNGDGTTTLEFSTQPEGDHCLMVQVDMGGIVLRQWDALAAENLARVQRGMHKEDVSRLLGSHRSQQVFTRSGEEVWDWRVRNDGPGVATLFNVHFIDDQVVRTSRTYVYPREGPYFGFWGGVGYPHGWGGMWAYPRPFFPHPFYPAYPLMPPGFW
jgi:hypothetical protein